MKRRDRHIRGFFGIVDAVGCEIETAFAWLRGDPVPRRIAERLRIAVANARAHERRLHTPRGANSS